MATDLLQDVSNENHATETFGLILIQCSTLCKMMFITMLHGPYTSGTKQFRSESMRSKYNHSTCALVHLIYVTFHRKSTWIPCRAETSHLRKSNQIFQYCIKWTEWWKFFSIQALFVIFGSVDCCYLASLNLSYFSASN